MAIDSPPFRDDVINPAKDKQGRPTWLMSRTWLNYIETIVGLLSATDQTVGEVSLTDQSAAIAATPIPTGTLSAGRYQVLAFLWCSQAAGVSSNFTLKINFTFGGLAFSKTYTGVNGNTTTSFLGDGALIIEIDAGPVTYEVAYASVGAPVGKFGLILALKEVNS